MLRLLFVLLSLAILAANGKSEETLHKSFPSKGVTVKVTAIREYLYLGSPVEKGKPFNDTQTRIDVEITNNNDVPVGVKFWIDVHGASGYKSQRFGGTAWLNPKMVFKQSLEGIRNREDIVNITLKKIEVVLFKNDGKPPQEAASETAQISVPKNPSSEPPLAAPSILIPAKEGKLAEVQKNLDAGANIDEADKYGYTALMWAVRNGHLPVVNYLLSKNVKVNAQANDDYTALMFAAQRGEPAIIKALVDGGANKALRQKNGFSAFDIAGGGNAPTPLQTLLR